jgi:hypothetical protein
LLSIVVLAEDGPDPFNNIGDSRLISTDMIKDFSTIRDHCLKYLDGPLKAVKGCVGVWVRGAREDSPYQIQVSSWAHINLLERPVSPSSRWEVGAFGFKNLMARGTSRNRSAAVVCGDGLSGTSVIGFV